MTDNYAKIVRDNLNRLYSNLPKDLAKKLPAEQEGERFIFNAFGEKCVIEPNRITLNEEKPSSVCGILISLYSLNACAENCIHPPFKPFKEFPGSMPFVGAFATNTEQLLVPHVEKIKKAVQKIEPAAEGEV